MRILKIVAIIFAVYVALVIVFESLIGYFQPASQSTITLVTTDADGTRADRVVSRLDFDGKVYVASNHWFRGWYNTVLDHPDIDVLIDGETRAYVVVPVEGAEADEVMTERPRGTVPTILMGFAPRYLVRLDPV